jgi:hypothetical protein
MPAHKFYIGHIVELRPAVSRNINRATFTAKFDKRPGTRHVKGFCSVRDGRSQNAG